MRRWALVAMVFGVVGLRAQVPAGAQHAMDEGAVYEQHRQFPAAMDSYRTALKAAHGQCVPCLDGLARAQMRLELFKESAATYEEVAKQSADAKAKAAAEGRAGEALFYLYFAQMEGRGDISKDPKKAAGTLSQAEAELGKAEQLDGANEPVRMLHGRVLAAMKRDQDAGREFEACAAAPGVSQQECTRAQRFGKDVSLARDEPAPQFELKTMDGKTVSLDGLAGKVVLIDFWATWCKYCIRDSDYVQSMVDVFDKDKFVLLEVSVDESDAAWSNYLKEHRLQGVQTHDADRSMSDLFHVTGYPTYVILDGDGTIRQRAVGIEGDLKGTVRKLLAGAVKAPAGEAVAKGQ